MTSLTAQNNNEPVDKRIRRICYNCDVRLLEKWVHFRYNNTPAIAAPAMITGSGNLNARKPAKLARAITTVVTSMMAA